LTGTWVFWTRLCRRKSKGMASYGGVLQVCACCGWLAVVHLVTTQHSHAKTLAGYPSEVTCECATVPIPTVLSRHGCRHTYTFKGGLASMCTSCNTTVPVGHLVPGEGIWCIPCHKKRCGDSRQCTEHPLRHFMEHRDAVGALQAVKAFHPSGLSFPAAPCNQVICLRMLGRNDSVVTAPPCFFYCFF
jgi:hypothetical protein